MGRFSKLVTKAFFALVTAINVVPANRQALNAQLSVNCQPTPDQRCPLRPARPQTEPIESPPEGTVRVISPVPEQPISAWQQMFVRTRNLTNRHIICEAFQKVSPFELCADAIDDVYLIETATSPWTISPLKIGPQIFEEPFPEWPDAPGYPYVDT